MQSRLLPVAYDKIAWLDADIWFENLKWFEITEKKLDSYKVLQLFESCHFLTPDGRIFRTLPAFILDAKNGHSGFAWAARRELWTKYEGLFDYSPLGCNDDLAARAIIGSMKILPGSVGSNPEAYKTWHKRISSWVNGIHSIVEGNVYHEWHGTLRNRAYSSRRNIIKHIDLTKVLSKADNQLLKWSTQASTELKIDTYTYFFNRKDDG